MSASNVSAPPLSGKPLAGAPVGGANKSLGLRLSMGGVEARPAVQTLGHDRPALDGEDLAKLFNRTPGTIANKLPELTAQHGFPPRLPGFGALWSRSAVLAWIERAGRADGPFAGLATADVAGEHIADYEHMEWPS